MQNQAPALRHFSQFSNQGSGTRRDFFVTHHASKDDNPQTFARYGFYRFFYHIETVSKKWIKTNITSCF